MCERVEAQVQLVRACEGSGPTRSLDVWGMFARFELCCSVWWRSTDHLTPNARSENFWSEFYCGDHPHNILAASDVKGSLTRVSHIDSNNIQKLIIKPQNICPTHFICKFATVVIHKKYKYYKKCFYIYIAQLYFLRYLFVGYLNPTPSGHLRNYTI